MILQSKYFRLFQARFHIARVLQLLLADQSLTSLLSNVQVGDSPGPSSLVLYISVISLLLSLSIVSSIMFQRSFCTLSGNSNGVTSFRESSWASVSSSDLLGGQPNWLAAI